MKGRQTGCQRTAVAQVGPAVLQSSSGSPEFSGEEPLALPLTFLLLQHVMESNRSIRVEPDPVPDARPSRECHTPTHGPVRPQAHMARKGPRQDLNSGLSLRRHSAKCSGSGPHCCPVGSNSSIPGGRGSQGGEWGGASLGPGRSLQGPSSRCLLCTNG